MQKIIRLARLELSVMFYSPIAWIILILIFLQCGLNYTETLYNQETQQQLERPLTVVTRVLFAGEKGMLSALIEYLYLYIPLLTMGVFSREYASGSIKLLQSSPITTIQIILGKYLAVVIYAALVVATLLVFVFSAYLSVEHFDLAFVLYGLLGLFLLICAYAAIGLFMSSLTTYQVVAAISTLALLAFLNYAPNLGAGIDGLREITHWMSIGGRAEEIVNGLLTSRELIYFVLIIGFFLAITVMRMEHERGATVWWKRWGRYFGLSFGLLLIGYISSLPTFNFYYDTTQIHDRTLSENGQDIAKRITGPITMTSFVNVLEGKAAFGAPKNRIGDIRRFEQYRRFIPQMKMEYVAYYDSIPYLRLDSGETMLDKAKKSADALGFTFSKLKTPEEMKTIPKIGDEGNVFVRFLAYDGIETPLRMYDDLFQYPGEAEISAALKRILDGSAQVAVLSGHGERGFQKMSDTDYQVYLNGNTVRNSIINQGFEVNEVTPRTLDTFDGVTLIIADPQQAYSEEDLEAILRYVDRGGNLFLLADPRSAIHLGDIMHKLGLRFQEGTLLQESENFEPDLLRLALTDKAKERGFSFYDKALVVMNEACGIEIVDSADFASFVLLETDPSDTWNKKGAFDLTKEKVVYDSTRDDYVQVATAVQLEREINGRIQKIFVTGDADFMSNSEIYRFNITTVNSSFATRIFKWFSDGEYPVSAPKTKAPDVIILVDRANINTQKALLLGLLPLAIGGVAVSILRKRKRK